MRVCETVWSTFKPHPSFMKIACLGWSSLIWKHGVLPVVSQWQSDGPRLPIEFAREGDNGELATVICPSASDQTSWWAMLAASDLGRAREFLRQREGIETSKPTWIGDTQTDAGSAIGSKVRAWGASKRLDAVIWTALPPRTNGVDGKAPSASEAVAYLSALSGDERAHAEQYVRRVPASIATANRSAIEAALGWTPAPFE